MKKIQYGFTLVELMVTLAIMAIFMAAAAPSIMEWVAHARMRGAAEGILSGLQQARGEAIKRNQVVTLWLVSLGTTPNDKILDSTCALSSSSASWVISLNNPEGLCDVAPTLHLKREDLLTPFIAGTNAQYVPASSMFLSAKNRSGPTVIDANSVSFNGYGQLNTPSTDITVIDITTADSSALPLRIEIGLAGSARLCANSGVIYFEPGSSTVPKNPKDPRACTNPP